VSTITEKEQAGNSSKLLYLRDFNEVFEFVKLAVNSTYKMKRAGLSLLLHGMPTRVGAYHVLGSNVIAVNSFVLDLVKNIQLLMMNTILIYSRCFYMSISIVLGFWMNRKLDG